MRRASSLSQGDFCPSITWSEPARSRHVFWGIGSSAQEPAVMKLFVWSLSMPTRVALKKLPTYQPSLIEGVYKVVIIFFKIIFQLMWGSCVHQRRFSRFQFNIFTLPIVYPAHQGGLCKWYAPLPKQNFAQPLFPVSPAHYNHPKEIVRQFFCKIYRG